MPEQATTVIAPVVTARPRRVDRRFYISMGLLMILFNVVAFGPSIIDQSGRNVPFHSRRWGRLTPSWLRRFSSSILRFSANRASAAESTASGGEPRDGDPEEQQDQRARLRDWDLRRSDTRESDDRRKSRTIRRMISDPHLRVKLYREYQVPSR